MQITSALSGLHKTEEGAYALSAGWLAKLLAILGEWPSTVFGAVSLLIVERNFRRRLQEKGRLIFFGVSTLITAMLMFYGSYKTIKTLTGGMLYIGHYIIIAVMTIVLMLLLRFICENISRANVKRLFGAALFTAAAALFLLIVMEVIKITWGRIRLTELVASGSLDGYTPWYIPNFFSGSKSFPSGHVANATLLLLIPLWMNNGNKSNRNIVFGIIALWIAGMSLARLCLGVHYLTDVCFGFGIAYLIVSFTYFIYDKTFSPPAVTDNTVLPL